MDRITLEQGMKLEQLSPDVFQSVQLPWTWPGTKTVPGGILMSLAAAAAYETISEGFSLKKLEAHFLAGPNPDTNMQQEVQRISDSGRFGTRVVTLWQGKSKIAHVTCSFLRVSAMKGRSLTHTVGRATTQVIDKIAIDDLEPGRNDRGPYMKFQRLPLVYVGSGPAPSNPPPESLVYTSAAQISPLGRTENEWLHILGVLCLSDYHILDAPPTLHGVTYGLPHIGDATGAPTENNFKLYTSLNHTVHFRLHNGFKADDLCYIEVASPWASEQRAAVQSRIFDRGGSLIATCEQEAFYVLKDKDNAVGKL